MSNTEGITTTPVLGRDLVDGLKVVLRHVPEGQVADGAKRELANMRGRVVREGRSQLARNGFRVGERICGGVRCRGALTL